MGADSLLEAEIYLKNTSAIIKSTIEKQADHKEFIGTTKIDLTLNDLKTYHKNLRQGERKNKIGLSFSVKKNDLLQNKNKNLRL